MWIDRHSEILLKRMAEQFPAVLVTGARQAGKTSILRHLYPHASYLSLDLPANAEAARTAPEQLLAQHPAPVIIDEIQYAPSLLRHLKYRIDQDRTPGCYLLTGSIGGQVLFLARFSPFFFAARYRSTRADLLHKK